MAMATSSCFSSNISTDRPPLHPENLPHNCHAPLIMRRRGGATLSGLDFVNCRKAAVQVAVEAGETRNVAVVISNCRFGSEGAASAGGGLLSRPVIILVSRATVLCSSKPLASHRNADWAVEVQAGQVRISHSTLENSRLGAVYVGRGAFLESISQSVIRSNGNSSAAVSTQPYPSAVMLAPSSRLGSIVDTIFEQNVGGMGGALHVQVPKQNVSRHILLSDKPFVLHPILLCDLFLHCIDFHAACHEPQDEITISGCSFHNNK